MSKMNILSSRINSRLALYVNEEGNVDYSLVSQDQLILDYYEHLKDYNLDDLKTKNEKLAFWINTYNMLTLYGVVKHLQANPKYIQKGNSGRVMRFSFFYKQKYQIGSMKINLYDLENKILRKQFAEPRIHFALNCASQSCPLLKNGLYSAETLDKELDVLGVGLCTLACANDQKTFHPSALYRPELLIV